MSLKQFAQLNNGNKNCNKNEWGVLQRAVFINKNQDATTKECYNEQMLQRTNATTNSYQ
jgi:hypothetical protein